MNVRKCIPTLLAAAALPLLAQSQDGPFGFHRGMTKEEVVRLVGAGAVMANRNDDDNDMLRLRSAPKPYESFEEYDLKFSPTGLVKVFAVGKDIRTSSYGSEVRESFTQIQEALTQTYGKPSNTFDHLRYGSIWNEPRDWMMGLLKKERTLDYFWMTGPYPNGITSIELEANALSSEKAYIVLSYEFEGFHEYNQQRKQSANKVF
jgi:hypothetical protein